ncbi:MAG TPA: YCF48-related protein, partial [Pyrinomonadaceae bacterium]|nr:YCF48-related protein [Pyrinomonadaceae bacterium]
MNDLIKTIWKAALFGYLLLFTTQTFYAQLNWTSTESGSKGDLVSVYFTSAERGFVAGDKGALLQTNDGGKTWTKQPIGTTEDINEIYFRNDSNGYVVAGKKLFATDDGGRSWREIKIYNPNNFRHAVPEFLSVRFADKKRGFLIGSLLDKEGDVVDSLVMRTDNGGESWSRIIVPSKSELFHLDFVNSSRG